jgi:lactoylglutathione lyase
MQLASVVLYVDQGAVPAALAFYERALGLTRRFYDSDYEFGELGAPGGAATLAVAAHSAAVRLMPGSYIPPAAGTPVVNVEVAFATPDVAGAFARAVAAGAAVLAAPYVLPWGQEVAYVRAPDGAVLGLCGPLPASPAPETTG